MTNSFIFLNGCCAGKKFKFYTRKIIFFSRFSELLEIALFFFLSIHAVGARFSLLLPQNSLSSRCVSLI
ncbi:hypothetical protein WHK05_14200, partial [Staphylococcus aureus]|uniref:hypothetical protein n=1 Tax=Staphylococcus aureus TaxID=1280 RepID=UPI0039BE4B75